MPVSYTRKQITDWLGSHTVTKARDYAHAVSELKWKDDYTTLAGKVQGTRSRPYDVWIAFNDVDEDMWIENECTCPVGFECKHVAALLIAGLEHLPKQPASGVRPELVTWLEGFRAARTAPVARSKKPATAKPTHALAYVIAGSYRGGPEIFLYRARVNADGTIRSFEDPWRNVENALVKPPKFVAEEDLPVLRGLWLDRSGESTGSFGLQGTTGAAVRKSSSRPAARSSRQRQTPCTPASRARCIPGPRAADRSHGIPCRIPVYDQFCKLSRPQRSC